MKLLAILLSIVCWTGVARADAIADAGKDHFEHGQVLLAGGEYLAARVEFMAGFELSHKPAFLFNAAECSRLAKDLAAARDGYERYLQLDPDGKLASLAKQRLAELPPVSPATVPPPAVASAPPVVPPPAVAAQRIASAEPAVSVVNTTPPISIEATPFWHRKAPWIVLGIAIVAGSVAAIYAGTRHHDTMACVAPECVVAQ
jgi:hypothetical protein